MARVLLTGATGFLGTRLAARLQADHEVWALTRTKPAATGKVNWLVQDLAADRWTAELPARIDAVIHLAQSADYRNFPAAANEIFAVSAATTMPARRISSSPRRGDFTDRASDRSARGTRWWRIAAHSVSISRRSARAN